jgi:exonuclease III
VWIHAHCSRFDADADRSILRREWDVALVDHCIAIRDSTGITPFVTGDHNVAPTTLDYTRNVIANPQFSSTPAAERTVFTKLLNSLDSVDAYLELQPDYRTAQPKGKIDINNFSWWNRGHGMQIT